jgi:photosystem II stability/assembly factor-like uncharacterized protein
MGASIVRSLLAFLSACSFVAGLAFAATDTTTAQARPDPLDTPVQPSDFGKKGATIGIDRRGERLIAVGPRGLILLSVDGAKSWKQIGSPVGTDLATVKFTDANTAWAVGHDGVALRSRDGGSTWERMLDGRVLLKLLQTAYTERVRKGEPGAEAVQKEITRSVEQSATPDVLPMPLLDVWFADANEGFIVGAFGLVLRTVDGGKTWDPFIEHTDNERRFHLYAVAGAGEQRYIAGEQGLLLRWDAARKRFTKVQTPYNGSYFGLDVAPGRLVAYGLRGNAFLSDDGGAQWRKIETGIDANLVALVPLAGGRFLLVSQGGHLLSVAPGSLKGIPLQVPFTSEVFAAAEGGAKNIVLAQVNGLRVVELLGLPGQ